MRIQNPFRVAFVATLGVGLGIVLIESVETLSTILLYIGTALFLSLGLEPVVSFLERRGLPRWAAVVATILAVLAVFAGIIWMIVPIIVGQVAQLVAEVTVYFQRNTLFEDLPGWIHSLFPGLQLQAIQDAIQNAQDWLLQNWGTITSGVINAGVAFFTGIGGAFIVLILTIYFTASTPALKASLYSLVPASKRARFIDLSEQITASVATTSSASSPSASSTAS